MLPQEMFWILTPSSPLSWVSESFRWDIGQFNSPRIKHLSDPFSRFQPGKFFLLKIYLLWKIWPISVKRWKPVWVRAWDESLYFYLTKRSHCFISNHMFLVRIFYPTAVWRLKSSHSSLENEITGGSIFVRKSLNVPLYQERMIVSCLYRQATKNKF